MKINRNHTIKSIFVLLILLLVWGGTNSLISRRDNKADFFWIWFGSRSVLEKTNPYSLEATASLQQALTGDLLASDQYQHPFPYPAYIAIVLLPFGILPYSVAYPIWAGLQFPMLFVALFVIMKFLQLDFKRLEFYLFFFAGSAGFFYPLVSYSLGQLSISMFLLFSLMYYFAQKNKITWAGICFAITAIRPDLFVLAGITLLILLFNSKRQIFRTGVAAIASFIALNISSFLFIGFWYPDWIKIILEYSGGNPNAHWPLEFLHNSTIRITFMLALFLYVLWQFYQTIRNPSEKQKLLLMSTVIIAFFLLNKLTGTYHMTLLLIPAFILLLLYKQINLSWVIWLALFSSWIYWFIPISGIVNEWASIFYIPTSFLILQIIYAWFIQKHVKTRPITAI